MSYSLMDYCDMIADSVRMDVYKRALERLVTPETVVLDIGCGSGVFSLLACKLGAKRVYGIDPDSSIKVAEKMVAANGFADRCTFYNKLSEDVNLPEKVDIIVSDLRGLLPIYGSHFPIINDARKRFLKRGGKQIPQADRLYMVPLSDSKLYKSTMCTWLDSYEDGLDFSCLTDVFSQQWHSTTLRENAVVGEPSLWAELDYTRELPKKIEKTASWTYNERVTLHGIGVWFDCQAWGDISFSSSPFSPQRPNVYGNAFFPFKSPLKVIPGDTLDIVLSAHQLTNDFVVNWHTEHHQGDKVTQFEQSSLAAEIPSSDTLRRRADNYTPSLNTYGHIELDILNGIKSGKTLGTIAKGLAETFPKQFPNWHKALTRVGAIASAYDESGRQSET